ncbi:hypothetical protein [Inquilinus sp. OTU3971]|uniref:hypothetical protein n=1 Tax=Inquilinus sp. OTU3971 TaxID=3043855 RepID=UPI00313CC7B4
MTQKTITPTTDTLTVKQRDALLRLLDLVEGFFDGDDDDGSLLAMREAQAVRDAFKLQRVE